MIKVLIVDDTQVEREVLSYVINNEINLEVMGAVNNGEEALKYLQTHKPDVITMDMHLPGMDGMETTKEILKLHNIPILIVSGSQSMFNVDRSFQALSVGALAVLEKPAGLNDPNSVEAARTLIETIKIVSKIKVPLKESPTKEPSEVVVHKIPVKIKAVAIGTSFGGPQALRYIFSLLPATFPVPIFVAQHIAPGFITSLIEWLSQSSKLQIKVAEENEIAKPGFIYFAPDLCHIMLHENGRIKILKSEKIEPTPSISHLFNSISKAYGSHSLGVLLTGMGKDGVDELLNLKHQGAITVVQSAEGCLLYGLPKEAILAGAASYVVPLHHIPKTILKLVDHDK